MIQRFEPGARYCTAVSYAGLLWVSGMVGWENQHGPVEAQVEEVLGRLDRALELAGTDRSRLLWVQVWLADIGHFDRMNAVWERWIPPAAKPARATVGAQLAAPGLAVEIAAVAALGMPVPLSGLAETR
ncbi:MAG: RidA family protein [Rhodospirillales bacterium]|nr:RidA family protein [Rhodospirillales bacterium]